MGAVLIGCHFGEVTYQFERTEEPVLYGVDGRYEVFEAPGFVRRAADSVAALVLGVVTPGYDIWERAQWADVATLCEGEAFGEQPSAAQCTSFLVAPDIVVTAGHCVSQLSCENLSVVFGFHYHQHELWEAIQEDEVFECREVLFSKLPSVNDGTDFAFIRLDRNVERSVIPLSFADKLLAQERVDALAFSGGVPMKWHSGGSIVANDVHPGVVWTDLDLFAGASGGLLLTSRGAAAIVSGGADDLESELGGTCQRAVQYEHSDSVPGERATELGYAIAAFCRTVATSTGRSLCQTLRPVRGCSASPAPSLAGANRPDSVTVVILSSVLLLRRKRIWLAATRLKARHV